MMAHKLPQSQHWLHDMQNEFNRLFERNWPMQNLANDTSKVATGAWDPQVDIQELPNAFVIHADLPGVDPKHMDVYMENGMLTVKGEKQTEKRDEKANFVRVERTQGSFYRRFALPETADGQNITATCKNGVLEVTIPKHEKSASRRIDVKSKD